MRSIKVIKFDFFVVFSPIFGFLLLKRYLIKLIGLVGPIDLCSLFEKLLKHSMVPWDYRQQPSPLLYSIDIWPARNSRLTQRETNHYIARWTSMLAWSYLAGGSPEQLVTDLFAQHQRFAVCCPYQ